MKIIQGGKNDQKQINASIPNKSVQFKNMKLNVRIVCHSPHKNTQSDAENFTGSF